MSCYGTREPQFGKKKGSVTAILAALGLGLGLDGSLFQLAGFPLLPEPKEEAGPKQMSKPTGTTNSPQIFKSLSVMGEERCRTGAECQRIFGAGAILG